jgi:hypothetical protein
VKLTARASDLATALALARRGVEAKANIDTSGTVLLRTSADGAGIEITGHTLTRMHTARCTATVVTPVAAGNFTRSK